MPGSPATRTSGAFSPCSGRASPTCCRLHSSCGASLLQPKPQSDLHGPPRHARASSKVLPRSEAAAPDPKEPPQQPKIKPWLLRCTGAGAEGRSPDVPRHTWSRRAQHPAAPPAEHPAAQPAAGDHQPRTATTAGAKDHHHPPRPPPAPTIAAAWPCRAGSARQRLHGLQRQPGAGVQQVCARTSARPRALSAPRAGRNRPRAPPAASTPGPNQPPLLLTRPTRSPRPYPAGHASRPCYAPGPLLGPCPRCRHPPAPEPRLQLWDEDHHPPAAASRAPWGPRTFLHGRKPAQASALRVRAGEAVA